MKLTQRALKNAFYQICYNWQHVDYEEKYDYYEVFAGIETKSYDIDIKEAKIKFIRELYHKLYEDYTMPDNRDFLLMFQIEYKQFRKNVEEEFDDSDIW